MVTLQRAKDVSDLLVETIQPAAIIMFGSVAKDGVGEDLDLLIVIDDQPERVENINLLVHKCLKKFYREFAIDPFVVSKSVVREYYAQGSPFLRLIFKEGRPLYMRGATKDWLKQAEGELNMARYLIQGRFFKGTCYHAQQAIEKAVKAMLLGKGWEMERTHSMARLIAIAAEYRLPIDLPDEDINFILADHTILHIEFEASEPITSDLIRYGHYDLELYNQRRQKIRRLVVYTSNVKKTSAGLDIGSVSQNQTPIHLGKDFDGDAIWQEIKAKVSNSEPLTGKDKLNIMLLPMMRSRTATPSQRAWQVTETVNQLPEENTAAYLIGVMVTANYSLLEDPEKSKILEVLEMAQPFQELYQKFEQKGRIKEKQKTARKLLMKGMTATEVVELTELSKEEVQKLKVSDGVTK